MIDNASKATQIIDSESAAFANTAARDQEEPVSGSPHYDPVCK